MKLSLACVLVFALGCGDDDGAISDASTPPSDAALPSAETDAESTGPEGCGDLMPTQTSRLHISQVELSTGRVELCNSRSEPVEVLGTWQWCQLPMYGPLPAMTIAPFECVIAQLELSDGTSGAFDEGGGELAIYDSSAYGTRSSMLDFVCWGSLGVSRRSTAEETLGTEVLWSGACLDAPADAVLRRLPGTAGTGAGDYEGAAALVPSCE